jgi:hypothetical protein
LTSIFQNAANIIGGNRGALGRAESAPTLSTIALKTVHQREASETSSRRSSCGMNPGSASAMLATA